MYSNAEKLVAGLASGIASHKVDDENNAVEFNFNNGTSVTIEKNTPLSKVKSAVDTYLPKYLGKEENVINLGLATLKNVLSYVNVVWLGLDNTGTTDNADLLQSIINTVPSGTTLYFPTGEYLLSHGITIDKSLQLIGDRKGRYLATNDSTKVHGSCLKFMDSVADDTMIVQGKNCWSLTIHKMMLFGNSGAFYDDGLNDETIPYAQYRYDVTNENVNGVLCIHSTDITDCSFCSFSGYGVSVAQAQNINQCKFYGNGIGVYVDKNDVMLRDCYITAGKTGIYCVGSKNIMVYDCYIDLLSEYGIYCESWLSGFINAYIDHTNYSGIHADTFNNLMVIANMHRNGMYYSGLTVDDLLVSDDSTLELENFSKACAISCKWIKATTLQLGANIKNNDDTQASSKSSPIIAIYAVQAWKSVVIGTEIDVKVRVFNTIDALSLISEKGIVKYSKDIIKTTPNVTVKSWSPTVTQMAQKIGDEWYNTYKKEMYIATAITDSETTWTRVKFNEYPILAKEICVADTAYEYGDVRRYGAIGDGVTDDTRALKIAFKNAKYCPGTIIKLEKNKTYIMRGGAEIGTHSYLEGNGATILVDKIDSFTDEWKGNYKNQFFMDNGYDGNVKVFDWKDITFDFSPELITNEELTEGDTTTRGMMLFKFRDCEEFRMTNSSVICDGDDRNAINLFKFSGHGKIFMDNCYFKNTQRYKENGSILWIQSALADGYYARINNCNFYSYNWDEVISVFCAGTHDVIIDGCTIEKYWYDTYYNSSQELAHDFLGFFVTNNYLTPTTFTDEEIAKIYHNVTYRNCKMICKPINEESTIGILGMTAFGNYYATPSMLKFENCNIDIQNIRQVAQGDTKNNYSNNIDWTDNANVIFDNCDIKFSNFIGNRGLVRSNSTNVTYQNCKISLDKYICNQGWVESSRCLCFRLTMTNNKILVTNANSSLFVVNPLAKEVYVITGNDFITTDEAGVYKEVSLLTESTAANGYDAEAVVFDHVDTAMYNFYSNSNRLNRKCTDTVNSFGATE